MRYKLVHQALQDMIFPTWKDKIAFAEQERRSSRRHARDNFYDLCLNINLISFLCDFPVISLEPDVCFTPTSQTLAGV